MYYFDPNTGISRADVDVSSAKLNNLTIEFEGIRAEIQVDNLNLNKQQKSIIVKAISNARGRVNKQYEDNSLSSDEKRCVLSQSKFKNPYALVIENIKKCDSFELDMIKAAIISTIMKGKQLRLPSITLSCGDVNQIKLVENKTLAKSENGKNPINITFDIDKIKFGNYSDNKAVTRNIDWISDFMANVTQSGGSVDEVIEKCNQSRNVNIRHELRDLIIYDQNVPCSPSYRTTVFVNVNFIRCMVNLDADGFIYGGCNFSHSIICGDKSKMRGCNLENCEEY